MDIDRANKWLALLANVGVLIGIVFLAIEIRSNTSAVQSSSIQSVTNSSAEGLRALASDSELSHIRRIGNMDPASLTEDEAYRYLLFNRNYWLTFQNNFFQKDLGILDAGIWNTYARILCEDIGVLGVKRTWPDHANVLDPRFVEFVESCPNFASK